MVFLLKKEVKVENGKKLVVDISDTTDLQLQELQVYCSRNRSDLIRAMIAQAYAEMQQDKTQSKEAEEILGE